MISIGEQYMKPNLLGFDLYSFRGHRGIDLSSASPFLFTERRNGRGIA